MIVVAVDVTSAGGVHQHVIARQQRRGLRPDVGEYQARGFLHRVARQAHAILQCAVGFFAGCFQTTALRIEEPTVVTAAYAVGLDAAVLHGRAAVRALRFDHADRAAAVAEQDEILAK